MPVPLEPLFSTITVLAHQGGWDEFLMVGAPVLVFAGLLKMANKRAANLGSTATTEQVDAADAAGPDDITPREIDGLTRGNGDDIGQISAGSEQAQLPASSQTTGREPTKVGPRPRREPRSTRKGPL